MTNLTAPLTSNDRCDRCGAQAHARTAHDNGPLLWCAHHHREHHARLAPVTVVYPPTYTKEPTPA